MNRPKSLPTLLVLDDDFFVLRQVRHMARQQFRVITASNTSEITEALLAELDTLVLDLNIPGDDSVLFLQSLAARAKTIRLILISGLELKTIKLVASVARLLKFRAVDIVQKPLTATALTPMLLCGRAYSDQKADRDEEISGLTFDVRSEIPRALSQNEMRAYFQPQISLLDGRFLGAEALCRWQHPALGILGPADFIDYVEDGQFALAFSLYMAEEALREFKHACEATRSSGHLSVNFPVACLQEPKLAQYLCSILEKHDFCRSKFIVEITERGISDDSTKSRATIAQLRICGFKISLDDFGTGYSSFEKLKDVAVDEIKIDRLFVSDAINSHTSQILILAALKIAEELELQVVAEGIENLATADWLARQGTVIGQGFLYSRPIPAEELTTFITHLSSHEAAQPGQLPSPDLAIPTRVSLQSSRSA